MEQLRCGKGEGRIYKCERATGAVSSAGEWQGANSGVPVLRGFDFISSAPRQAVKVSKEGSVVVNWWNFWLAITLGSTLCHLEARRGQVPTQGRRALIIGPLMTG